jgi:hypothetical protein
MGDAALEPATCLGSMPRSPSARSTPIWAMPREPPPDSAMPTP